MGTTFADNTTSLSYGGIHTDNSNAPASSHPDEIVDNDITCYTSGFNSYGIYTFLPYADTDVQDNTVTGCAVGLAALGGPEGAGPRLRPRASPTTSSTEPAS